MPRAPVGGHRYVTACTPSFQCPAASRLRSRKSGAISTSSQRGSFVACRTSRRRCRSRRWWQWRRGTELDDESDADDVVAGVEAKRMAFDGGANKTTSVRARMVADTQGAVERVIILKAQEDRGVYPVPCTNVVVCPGTDPASVRKLRLLRHLWRIAFDLCVLRGKAGRLEAAPDIAKNNRSEEITEARTGAIAVLRPDFRYPLRSSTAVDIKSLSVRDAERRLQFAAEVIAIGERLTMTRPQVRRMLAPRSQAPTQPRRRSEAPMAQQLKSQPPTSDEIVSWPTRPKYRPRWTIAYISVAVILWSAVVVLAVRAMSWLAQV
jgi:hypothetical protein